MSRKAALIVAGVITSMVMVLGFGMAGGAHWFDQQVSTANAEDPSATAISAAYVNPADVAALQAQVNDYRAALQEANAQLQAAYDEIAALQAQGRFLGEHEENEHSGRFFSPFDND